MKLVPIVFATALLPCVSAHAHDFWDNGDPVDPITKNRCCGKNDCKSIDVTRTHETDKGWNVLDSEGTWRFLTFDRVQPSPDGHFHICEWGGAADSSSRETPPVNSGRIKCFFAPMNF